MSKDRNKVLILYRVLQGWRVPVFEKLNELDDIELRVFHGKSFSGTKVINYSGETSFIHKELPTIGINLPTRNGRAVMPINLTIVWELFRYGPDVIICEGASNLANNFLAYAYKIIFRKKMIWWSLGEIKNREKSNVRKILEAPINFLEKKVEGIISYSSFGAEYFYNLGIKKEKVFVAVNVIDTDKKKVLIKSLKANEIYINSHKNSKFNILFVGAITKEKKLEVLLEAFVKLEKIIKDVSLTIVGDGEFLPFYKDLAKNLRIKNIKFTGMVVEEVSKYFLESDIFVLPGLGGLAVSESLTHGVPVIASIADGCEKDLLGSGAGIIEEALDSNILHEHLLDLYYNPQKLKKMKEEAVNVINNRYNIKNYVRRIKESIDYVIG